MRSIRIVSIVFCLLVLLCGCRKKSQQDRAFAIGVAAPFSGQEGAAVYGHNIQQAVDMAVEVINAKGGVRGTLLSVEYEDTQLLPSVAVGAVTKLITVDRCSVIIGAVASSSTKACAKVADRHKAILISPGSTSNELSGISPYLFRIIAPDVFEGEAMAEFAKEQGYDKVAVAFVDNAGTRGPAEVFRRWSERNGVEICAFEVVAQGQTDVRSQMTKLISTRPDAVYLLGYALELGSMIRKFREQDMNVPMLSFQVMEEPKVRDFAPPFTIQF